MKLQVRPRGRSTATPRPATTTIQAATTIPAATTTAPAPVDMELGLERSRGPVRPREPAVQWLARVKPTGPPLLLERPSIIRPIRVRLKLPKRPTIPMLRMSGIMETRKEPVSRGRRPRGFSLLVPCQSSGVLYSTLSSILRYFNRFSIRIVEHKLVLVMLER